MASRNRLSLFSSLSDEDKQRVIQLLTEIRADVQFLILINAKHPCAEVVREVRSILALVESQASEKP